MEEEEQEEEGKKREKGRRGRREEEEEEEEVVAVTGTLCFVRMFRPSTVTSASGMSRGHRQDMHICA